MDIEIVQSQDTKLLTEHAESSFNFTFMIKNEWILASIYLIIGLIIFISTESLNKITGIIGIVIGCWELYKYPRRIKKWVSRKEKEKIFNKEIIFGINQFGLKVKIDDDEKSYKFSEMRACHISETGILFKISYPEYYYISFKSVKLNDSKEKLIDFLKANFEPKKFKTHLN